MDARDWHLPVERHGLSERVSAGLLCGYAAAREKQFCARQRSLQRCGAWRRCGWTASKGTSRSEEALRYSGQNESQTLCVWLSVSKNLVEFRPAGRNKMEIHFIRRLCRPEKYISPRKCGICAQKAHKLCAQSRRSPFCQESVSFFDSLSQTLCVWLF